MIQTKDLKRIKVIYSLLAVVFIIFGACLMIRPELSMVMICRLAGILFILYGIVKITGYFTRDLYELAFQFDFAMGIFSIAIGCALIFFVDGVITFFPTFIGVVILIDAVLKIQTALDARRFGLNKWWLILIIAILAGVAGFLLIIYPREISQVLIMFVGLNLMIDGILNLWIVLYTVKIMHRRNRSDRERYEGGAI
ncbi:MAG: DUF308 domain-containing protein [Lachnospiraceae bacterium]|nr:DUF308 domain-containing protein [Lachnospiraceae bacterium]